MKRANQAVFTASLLTLCAGLLTEACSSDDNSSESGTGGTTSTVEGGSAAIGGSVATRKGGELNDPGRH